MNDRNNEIRVCKKCGKEVPLNRIKIDYRNGKRYFSNICRDCYNDSVRQARRNKNIQKFIEDESMKIQRHYKQVRPGRIFPMEQYGITPAATDEVFVKLLDYKDSWISNYGRALTRYGDNYCLKRKKYNENGEIAYQLNRNVFDGKRWVYEKVLVEAWALVVQEFIVNYDIANNTCCWHTGNNKEDNYYKHIYPLNKYQFNAVLDTYLESKGDSEKQILEIMNSADYRPDGWNPVNMKRSALGIGYLGCSDVDVQSTIYRKWHNMLARCYNSKIHEYKPYYEPCTVSEEWHNYSNFREWFRQNNIEGRKFDLDKDLLIQGNTVYGSDTCALITHYANTIFEDRGIKTNIVQDQHTGLYDTSMSILGKRKEIGSFEKEEKAQRELLAFKKQFIIKYARKNRNRVPNKVYEAILEWKIEVAD